MRRKDREVFVLDPKFSKQGFMKMLGSRELFILVMIVVQSL